MDVVVKIADHSETSDNMGQGVAEQEPRKGVRKKKLFVFDFFWYIPQRRSSTRVENLNPNTIVLYWSGKFRSLPNFWFHWFRKTWWDHQWKTFSEEISGTGSGWSESFITGETGFDAKITGVWKWKNQNLFRWFQKSRFPDFGDFEKWFFTQCENFDGAREAWV